MMSEFPAKSRVNPHKETIEQVPGYPSKLKIFKVPCSRYYWARVYLSGRYQVKSLKTENRQEALNRAKKFYEDALVNIKVGFISPKTQSFAYVGKAFLTTLKGIGNPRLHYDDNYRFKKVLLPHFGEKDIRSINHSDLLNLLQKLTLRNYAPSTISKYMVGLRKILKHAANNEIIDRIPEFPRIPNRSSFLTKRDYFERSEIKLLIETVEKLSIKNVLVRGIPVSIEFKYLIQFMVNSFLRPSDLRVLKHIHVHTLENANQPNENYRKFLLLKHPATKTTDHDVVTMPEAHAAYIHLVDFHKTLGYGKQDDYVFFPQYKNRNTMIGTLGRIFRFIVKTAGISSETEQHTVYSLRHSAIMFRLQMGNVDVLKLDRNDRTSVQMIERFYASRLTNIMAINVIHGTN